MYIYIVKLGALDKHIRKGVDKKIQLNSEAILTAPKLYLATGYRVSTEKLNDDFDAFITL